MHSKIKNILLFIFSYFLLTSFFFSFAGLVPANEKLYCDSSNICNYKKYNILNKEMKNCSFNVTDVWAFRIVRSDNEYNDGLNSNKKKSNIIFPNPKIYQVQYYDYSNVLETINVSKKIYKEFEPYCNQIWKGETKTFTSQSKDYFLYSMLYMHISLLFIIIILFIIL